MKSNKTENSEGKIEKVTESLWKVWWFSFYLVIVPSLVAVVGFFIYFFVGKDLYVSIGLSVITFMFVLLFFYKSYDKYRNDPFFLNKKNNLSARINIIFLIAIFSLIVTPIIVLLAPGDNYFELLPLISYILLYNIVYYYLFYQPIDSFDFTEQKYKHEAPFSQWIKRPYNFIILFNYFVHILFLSYTFDTKISWVFPLLTNILFYPISRLTVSKNIKRLTNSDLNERSFLRELITYKKKFINMILSLDFALLIQMPFAITFVYIFMGIHHEITEIITISFLTLILLSFYFKIRLYVSSYYNKILRRYDIYERD
jgi:hypothetical protein